MKTLNNRDQKDIYMQYLNDISRYPLLTREQETVLLQKSAEGNKAALDMLVNSNLRFVVNIANLYKGRGLDIMEALGERSAFNAVEKKLMGGSYVEVTPQSLTVHVIGKDGIEFDSVTIPAK